LTGAIWYPCATEAQSVFLGSLAIAADATWLDSLPGVKDCPVAGTRLPLVIVSHGRGGWFAGHYDVAGALANAGFIVAAINHPGDTVNDGGHRDDLSILASRPADMIRLLDFMLNDWKDSASIDRTRIGFFGFSRGGFTGLVLAGGKPDFHRIARYCPESDRTPACEQFRKNEVPAAPPHDARIKAAVVADPGPTYPFTSEKRLLLSGARRGRDLGQAYGSRYKSGDPNCWLEMRTTWPVSLASLAACPASLTFVSWRTQAIGRFYRPAQPRKRQVLHGFAPTQRTSIAPSFTTSSTRPSSASSVSI
jgi:dienelactone hydrolase